MPPRGVRVLDPSNPTRENIRVQGTATKVIGKVNKTPWQRFVRIQRTAARLALGRGQPKGIFRFATNEECSRWTANLNRNGK